jgi:hypothetical protein
MTPRNEPGDLARIAGLYFCGTACMLVVAAIVATLFLAFGGRP